MASPSSSTDYPDKDEGASRPPACAAAPLLWSLLPLVAGILAAKAGAPWLAILAAAGYACSLMAFGRSRTRKALVVAVSFIFGVLSLSLRTPVPDPSWSWRPPREAVVEMVVRETFNARKPGHVAGIGYIRSTGLAVDTVSGSPAAYYLEGPELVTGEVIRCRAVLRWLPAETAPDDYQQYLLGRDIHLTLNQGKVIARLAPPPPMERLRQRLSAGSQSILTAGCREPDDPGNTLASMLLGMRSLLTDERIELYRKTGTYHLFAVSGLHVGSVAACLYLLCRLARLRRPWPLMAVLAGTWYYVWLTGAPPSAVRAGIMISCVSLARVVLRQPHLFPALALSAWLVLLIDPRQLFHLGFQLSYAVVGAIILVGLPMAQQAREYIGRRRSTAARPLPQPMARFLIAASDLLWVSLSASIASAPLILQHFNLLTPGGILFGMLLNPLASLCVMAGCVALLTGPLLGMPLGGVLPVMTWPLISLMEAILRLCLRIPGAVATREWAWEPAGTVLVAAVLGVAWALQHLRMHGNRVPAALYLLPHAMVQAAILAGVR